MPGHGNKITRKQEAAVAALMMEPTIAQAAKKCGISKDALLLWMKRPAFQLAYEQARKDVVESAQRRLEAATGHAIDTLVAVTKKSKRAGDRVRAALGILTHAFGQKIKLDGDVKQHHTLTVTIEQALRRPDFLEFLEQRALDADRDASAIRADGQPVHDGTAPDTNLASTGQGE